MKAKLKNYTARWELPGRPALGNVSFQAKDLAAAIKTADRIGVEIGLPRMPRNIVCDGQLVHSKDFSP